MSQKKFNNNNSSTEVSSCNNVVKPEIQTQTADVQISFSYTVETPCEALAIPITWLPKKDFFIKEYFLKLHKVALYLLGKVAHFTFWE